MIKIYQSIAQVQMVAPLQSAEPRGSPKDNEVHSQRRLLFKLFCSFLISYFLLGFTVNAQTHSQYWTSADVATYNMTYNSKETYVSNCYRFNLTEFNALVAKYGDAYAAAEGLALEELGWTEVPVEGALRSDYTGTIPDPDPDQGNTGGSGNVEGGELNMDEMIASLTLIFESVVGWTGTIGETIVATPLLMFVVCMGLAKPAVKLFGMLFRLGR